MNLDSAIAFADKKAKESLDYFYDGFPSEQSNNLVYSKIGNVSWTGGFYTGILWLLYELTGDEAYYKSAKHHSLSFEERLNTKTELDHHDLGFLFSLSSVADYKVTGDERAKAVGIKAADYLLKRYHPGGRFIQAWGSMNDPDSYRFIIDCLLNLPLLFWASEVTGDKKYYDAAYEHMKTAIKYIVRDDGSTYHTFFLDPKTNEPLRGETHQGFSDDSCWARGQAWGIYGLALCYRYTHCDKIIPVYDKVTKYFIKYLPEDRIPYWDLCFGDGSGEPRDTSAAAIAVCGIMEMNKYVYNSEYDMEAEKMLNNLSENYTTAGYKSNGFLKEGMYSRKFGHKPECNIWGDYFYLEALAREKDNDRILYW